MTDKKYSQYGSIRKQNLYLQNRKMITNIKTILDVDDK